MKCKRIVLLIISIFLLTILSCSKKNNANKLAAESNKEYSMDELLQHNFGFTLRSTFGKNPSKIIYEGSIIYKDGKWTCEFDAVGSSLKFLNADVYSNSIDITYLWGGFSILGKPPYRDYVFPFKYTVNIKKDRIIRRINGEESSENIFIDSIPVEDGFSSAIIITDNLRIRSEPNLNAETKIIGKLNKYDDVLLIGSNRKEETIEGITAPWYKIQLADGSTGWIFGGFAKIYFYEEEILQIKKAFAEEGSEYTNQISFPENN